MSRLILMRHGRAAFGADRYDSLSSQGLAQATATGAWLAGNRRDIAMVRHGPRRRQIDTATAALTAAGIASDRRLDPALDEFAEGEEILAAAGYAATATGGDAAAHRARLAAYARAVEAWAAGAASIPGRADFAVFRRTVADWFAAVVGDDAAPSGRTELVVTSAGVIAAVVCETLALPDARWIDLVRTVANASLSEIVFSRGRIGLASFNAAGHLPADLASTL